MFLFLFMIVDVILAVTYLITGRRERPHESRPHRKTRGVVVQSDAGSWTADTRGPPADLAALDTVGLPA